MCGEHVSTSFFHPSLRGSSPRVRGTHRHRRPRHPRRGIIPACAGNTGLKVNAYICDRDHPRVCGEHMIQQHVDIVVAGSSPRVRGTPRFGSFPRMQPGIIPACAGNTRKSRSTRPPCRDHPRVCGEHDIMVIGSLEDLGSSPRVRGTRRQLQYDVQLRGIIPACAGNTSIRRTVTARCGDHPRVCGEHDVGVAHDGGALGSSPRVRGTLRNLASQSALRGIIPACAGNT